MKIIADHGITWVDAKSDAAFRQALLDGCPVLVRPKMREALAATPQKDAAAHSMRYFGSDLKDICRRVGPLIDELHWFLHHDRDLPEFKRWLAATNYANDYRMIKAMVAWADYKIPSKQESEQRWPVH